MWAVDDVLFGEKAREPVVEEADAPDDEPVDGITVHLVPGDARASWARVPGNS
jgi:hypothetical protein